MRGPTGALLVGMLMLLASPARAATASLALENDSLSITIDPRTASIASVMRKHGESGPQSVPVVTTDLLGLRIPVGTWDGHTVSSTQAATFKVENRTATSLTLVTTRFTSDAGTFPVALRIRYRLDGDNVAVQLQLKNLGKATIDGITFPAIAMGPAADGSETFSMADGARPLRLIFSDNRIRTHHDPFERLDPEDLRGWIHDDPAFPAKAFQYPSLLHTAWMHYGGGNFGVGLDVRDRSIQVQFGVIERKLTRDRRAVSANKRTYELSWRWVPLIEPGASWESPEALIKFDGGDWHSVARQHREWLATWLPRPQVAQRFRESLGWLSRPVSNFDQIPELARQGVEAGAPYMIVYGWYGSGMYGLSYDYYPQATLGGVESLRRNLRKARDLGACPLAWYNGTDTSEITREHREHARDWVVINRHGGIVIDGRWTLFEPNRPPTTEDNSTLMNLDMGSGAGPFNTDNVRRMIHDYGYCGFEMDQGYKDYPSYSRTGEGSTQPEYRYMEGARAFFEAARDIVKKADPNGIIVGEGYNDLLNQYVDSTWIFDGGLFSEMSDFPRYSLPWITQPTGIFTPDKGYANRAFMMNAPFDIFLDLANQAEFVEHLRKLHELKRAVAASLYDWDFSGTDGFSLQTGDAKAVQARSYIAADGRIAVVVVNTSDRQQSAGVELTNARGAIALHRLGAAPTNAAAMQPLNLDLAPFEVNVLVSGAAQ